MIQTVRSIIGLNDLDINVKQARKLCTEIISDIYADILWPSLVLQALLLKAGSFLQMNKPTTDQLSNLD